mmetsp:Transcript_77257/g.136340  ORF Transcript_77257/g.136340 Transcript_77257/m.136340 type:complete len:369 (+) Transcript_77257:74-1180(+)
MKPRRAGQRPNGAKALVLTLALFGAALSACSMASQAQGLAALLGRGKPKRTKVLLEAQGFQLLFHRGKGKVPLPWVQLRRTPKKPVSFAVGGSVESGMSTKDALGFPFTTQNNGILQIGFPRFSGRLQLSMEDPASTADDDAQGSMELSYLQALGPGRFGAGAGEFGGKLRGNGEWSASFAREVEDIGKFRGSLNSQLDWSADLDQSYPAVKGMVPSVTYGATQDGMRVRASVDGDLKKNVHGSYSLRNIPGKYAPMDFIHEAKVKVGSSGARQTLEAVGSYDRKFAKLPVRGSLTYSLKTRPATLEASVDFDRYRLRAQTARAQAAAAVARVPDENGQRAAEVELKVGKVSAVAQLPTRRVRLNMNL